MANSHGTAFSGAGIRLRKGHAAQWVAASALILLLIAATTPVRADFQAGAEAYGRGDYQKAISEWQPYADNGDPRALFNLGQMYRLGAGVEKDTVKAETYYRRAADLGHVGAAGNLGSLLFDRRPPQGAEAVTYWRQAARGGDAKSQYLLGIQYFNGDFIQRDYVQAYAWLSLAARSGVREPVEALATVRSYMEPKAIDEATRLAGTLIAPQPAQASVSPGEPAALGADTVAVRDSAVLRHPVDDLSAADLSTISPDAVVGAIPIPSPDEFPPASVAVPVRMPATAVPAQTPAPATPKPDVEPRSVEYRAQFASFRSEREAKDLQQTLLGKHAKLLKGVGVEIDALDLGASQGIMYRVRTGPLKTEAAVKTLCAGLDGARIVCQPAKTMSISVAVRPDGEPAAGAARAVRPVAVAQPTAPQPAAAPPPPMAAPAPEASQAAADEEQASGPGPQAAHTGDNWRVQVGAGRTEEEARFRWARLMGGNAELLDAAELYIYKADLGPRGVFYRVQIGGFDTRPAAIGLCERLKARKVDCFVTGTRP